MCERCGQLIDPQRIEALPETKCCVGCSCVKCRSALDIELDGPEMRDLVNSAHTSTRD